MFWDNWSLRARSTSDDRQQSYRFSNSKLGFFNNGFSESRSGNMLPWTLSFFAFGFLGFVEELGEEVREGWGECY